MGWDIVPEGLYRQVHWVNQTYGPIDLYITENGAAFDDALTADGTRCHDPERVDYLRSHLAVCRRLEEGGSSAEGLLSLVPPRQLRVGLRFHPAIRHNLRRLRRLQAE